MNAPLHSITSSARPSNARGQLSQASSPRREAGGKNASSIRVVVNRARTLPPKPWGRQNVWTDDFQKEVGDDDAFYLPCCWDALTDVAARDHCFRVRPTIPSGEPPPRAPAAAGHFSARWIGRACMAAGPDCYPHFPSVPPRSAIGTPQPSDF
jgi:hypothetical protein